MNWKEISFGDFIEERKGFIDPNDSSLYSFDKISKIDFSKGEIKLSKYSPTKTKQIIVYPNDFVFSGLNIEKGAVTINTTQKKLVVSANYSTCAVDYSIIDKDYFLIFMKSNAFKDLLSDYLKKDYGFTRPKHLYNLKFLIPNSLDEQIKIVNRLKEASKYSDSCLNEITLQKSLLYKLKESILLEAIQGKLTSDWRKKNPTNEHAKDLLQRIESKKGDLIKNKKIKKSIPLPPITKEEIPFEIPEGWVWCRLGQICHYITKGTTPAKNELLQTGDVPYLKVYNIVNQKIDFDYKPQFISRKVHEEKLTRSKVLPNDILMNIVGPPLGKVAIVPNDYDEWNINQALAIYRPIIVEINKFIYYYLDGGLPFRSAITKGVVGQDNLSLKQAREVLFPLAPLEEQKAIIAKVEILMQKWKTLEEEIKTNEINAKILMQAILKEAFEGKKEEVEV